MSVFIRPFELQDAPALLEAIRESTEQAFPWLPWCHPEYRIEEAHEWIAQQVRLFEERTQFEFVIESHDNRFLGGCGLSQINLQNRYANLGYWVRTSATRDGVATRAVRLVAGWAFANTDLERLEIVAAAGNAGSQRVAEKAGAQREGVLRSRILLHDRFHDAVVYSMLRSSEVGA